MTSPQFRPDPMPTAEVERQEALHAPLANAVRDLLVTALETDVPAAVLAGAQADVETVVERLRSRQTQGPLGVRYNDEGRTWAWGNAVIGPRNATAPPLDVVREAGRPVHASVTLGAVHQGEPGVLHPGVAAKLLDHLMGVTASDGRRVTMTATLTVRHRRPTPLGPVRLEGRIDREEGHKVHVSADLSDEHGVTVEAEGLFVVPRWAR